MLVFKTFYDYLLFNVAKLKCSFYALILFKHLKPRISPCDLNISVIENNQIHDVTYLYIFYKKRCISDDSIILFVFKIWKGFWFLLLNLCVVMF